MICFDDFDAEVSELVQHEGQGFEAVQPMLLPSTPKKQRTGKKQPPSPVKIYSELYKQEHKQNKLYERIFGALARKYSETKKSLSERLSLAFSTITQLSEDKLLLSSKIECLTKTHNDEIASYRDELERLREQSAVVQQKLKEEQEKSQRLGCILDTTNQIQSGAVEDLTAEKEYYKSRSEALEAELSSIKEVYQQVFCKIDTQSAERIERLLAIF